MSVLALQFDDQRIRIMVDDTGAMWWVAQDIGDILGIQKARNTIERFPEDEKGAHTIGTPGGDQRMLTVNEPGLYRLIFQSRKPQAEAFKRWVFHDVLPTLRRTGVYTAQAPIEPSQGLTTGGYLPAPQPAKPREHAEVSAHMVRVWTLLRDSGEPLSNREISVRADVSIRTATYHTKYLCSLGVIDKHEIHPRHLYEVSPNAKNRNSGAYERLEYISEIISRRVSLM